MQTKGVDLSYCQKGIDYSALAASGVKFAIIRAGYSEAKDRLLDTHVRGCEAAGVDIGFYWYSYAKDADSARREAEACVKAISAYSAPKYPIFFDAEESGIAEAVGRDVMTDIALEFIACVERGGYPCGLYANPSWMENYYVKQRLLTVDIWLAHWTNSPSKRSKYDYGQVIWQWGTEKLGGVTVDADVCFIDYPARTAAWYAGRGACAVSLDKLAREVILGKWGNGAARKAKLTAAGFDYISVQARVNELLAS